MEKLKQSKLPSVGKYNPKYQYVDS